MTVDAYWLCPLILLQTLLIEVCTCQRILLTISDDGKCITNTSSAMAPIYDRQDIHWQKSEEFVTEVKYVGNTPKKLCSIYDNCHYSGHSWATKSSLESSPVDNLVVDRRWEDFPTHVTKHVDDLYKELQYENVGLINTVNFVVPFSVQIDMEAHIFLCETYSVPSSRCYWFLLQGWDGKRTAFRKCNANEIQTYYDGSIPKGFCATSTYKKKHNRKFPTFLSDSGWTHLKISKKGTEISLLDQTGNVLMITDIEEFELRPHVLYFHSEKGNGFWKLHNFDYFYIDYTGMTELRLEVWKGHQCLSAFVAMCQQCTMEIEFLTYSYYFGENQLLYRKLLYQNSETKWHEEKFCFNVDKNTLYLRINRNSAGKRGIKQFWALSDIRSIVTDDTENSELRILGVNETKWAGKCQFLKSGEILDVTIQSTETLGSWNKCNDFQFGEACWSCNSIFSSQSCPKQSKYCQLVEYSRKNISKKCYCTIGYQGSTCKEKCESKSYGHSCIKRCRNCQDGCKNDTISGKCDYPGFCSDNYQGERCDQPLGLFLFDTLPEVKAGYTSCELILQSFTGRGDASKIKYYKFQYREAGTNNEWLDVDRTPLIFNFPEKVEIRNLKVQTSYEVRAFGYGEEEDLAQLSHVTPDVKIFTTYCDGLNVDTLNVSVEKTSVRIYATTALHSPCQFTGYYIYLNNTRSRKIKDAMINETIDGLEPSSYYELKILKDRAGVWLKPFKTKDSEPERVQSFEYEKVPNDPSSLILSWKKPYRTNGDLLFYTISAKLERLSACLESPSNPNSATYYVSAGNVNVTIPVKPYAEYTFEIQANNSAGFGPSSQITVATDSLEQIKEEEIPHFKSTNPERKEASFEFDVNCESMMGPLTIILKIWGTDPWCTTSKEERSGSPSSIVTVTNLEPFCNYTATIQFVRGKASSKEVGAHFRTKESVPTKITDILITSKGPDHVSIRWTPPFPPTGHLEGYHVEICSNELYWNGDWTNLIIQNFSPVPCKLWPEFHCVTINSITKNYVHQVKISSKNKGYDEYSQPVAVKFEARETSPGKPYGLNASWTDQNYLNLEWFHPLQTNGHLKSFEIFMDNNEISTYNISSENDYQPAYRTTVMKSFDLPGNYKIAVQARNSQRYSNKEVRNIASPPPIPENDIEKIDKSENAITIKFRKNTYKKNFKLFLYILISECDSCQNSLIQFRKEFEAHHKLSDEVKPITTISFWRMVPPYTYKSVQKDIVIGKPEYVIKKEASYTLAFIWISKYGSYVRSNHAIKYIGRNDSSEGQSTFHAGKITAVVLVLIIVVVAASFAFKRFRKTAIKNMFADDISATDTSEPTYVNKMELTGQRTRMRTLRPMSIIVTEEICPGVPLFKTVNSKRVKLEYFEDYVRDAIESGELKRQHENFPRGQTKDWTYGTRPENKAKNRYQNLIAYDHTRVVLQKINNDEYSDYINANFIDGYRHPRAYIATQGPKKNTVSDFWRMIWQEKVTHIVMMANVIEGNKKKTEQYWPNINEEATFGDYRVSFISSEIHANYEYRKLELQYKYAKPRQVGHLHFKVWPDHGVPLYPQSLVPFLQKMLTLRSRDFPLVVHCSAGVGRTGTVILCDLCLRMAAAEGYVDVLSMLEHLRSQRPNMVDNVEQYKLAHLVILNCLTGMNTSIPINENFAKAIGEIGTIESQLTYIRNCEWQDDAMKTVAFAESELPPIVPAKNRFPQITPDPAARVFLHPYPPASPAPSSTYINAVQVDGFCQPGRFIVTQFPLPGTISDFWRLVSEKKISVIVCLNEILVKDPTCKRFWPEKNNNEFRPIKEIKIKHIKNKHLQVLSIMTFELSSSYEYQESQTRTVEIVKFHGWTYPDPVPDYSDFITFVEDVTAISRGSEHVLVTCFDGATASGLFIAMTFLMEKIKLEQECDVCQAVRSIRTSRKMFTNSKDQLEFLYKASILYVEEQFFHYSNMNLQAK